MTFESQAFTSPVEALVDPAGVEAPELRVDPDTIQKLQRFTRPDGTALSVHASALEPALYNDSDPAPWSEEAKR